MKIKNYISNLLALVLLVCFALNTTGQERTCAAHEQFLEENKNPAILKKRNALEQNLQQEIQRIENLNNSNVQYRAQEDSVYIIPVVFHVMHTGGAVGTGDNISNAALQNQINQLNLDFRKQNTDVSSNWTQSADAQIEFCIAKVDTNGNATTGITRHQLTSMLRTSAQVNTLKPSTIWDPSKYMNFWVVPDIYSINGNGDTITILGYAQFPGGNVNTDGVVVSPNYIGSMANPNSNSTNFGLGRTGTHEVGHYLNLRHIWGDGGCSFDDGLADTPLSDAANYNCNIGHVSCGTTDMVENFMDYSDDDCLNIFTANQVSRMRATLRTSRAGLATASCVQNDYCSDAIIARCGNTYTGSNIDATTDTAGICFGTSNLGHGVWYKIDGINADITLSTDFAATNFDTEIYVYEGDCSNLVCVTGDDDGGTGTKSELTFFANGGTTYFVLVGGYNTSTTQGSFQLGITCADACPPVVNTITNSGPKCDGETGINWYFTGSPNAILNVTITGIGTYNVTLNNSGTGVIGFGPLPSFVNSSPLVLSVNSIDLNGCTGDVTNVPTSALVVNPLPEITSYTINQNPACEGNVVFTVTGTPNSSYQVLLAGYTNTFNIGSSGTHSATANNFVPATGTYQLLNISKNGCTTDLTNEPPLNYTIVEAPELTSYEVANTSGTPQLEFCQSVDNVQFQFEGTPNATVVVQVPNVGTYSKTLNANGTGAFFINAGGSSVLNIVSIELNGCTIDLSDLAPIPYTVFPESTNNICADAVTIAAGDTIDVNINQCIPVNNPINCFTNGVNTFPARSAWFTFEGDGATYELNQLTSSIPVQGEIIMIYEGDCNNYSCIDYNNGGSTTINTTCGQDYYIMVSGFNTNLFGDVSFTLTETAPANLTVTVTSDTLLCDSENEFGGDGLDYTFSGTPNAVVDFVVTGFANPSIQSITLDANGEASFGYVAFLLDPNTTYTLTVTDITLNGCTGDTTGIAPVVSFNSFPEVTSISIVEDDLCTGDGFTININGTAASQITIDLVNTTSPGNTVFGPHTLVGGSFTFNQGTTLTPGNYFAYVNEINNNGCIISNPSDTVNFTISPTPSNDTCAAPISIACADTIQGNNTCAPVYNLPDCGYGGNYDLNPIWYSFTGNNETVILDACNADFNSYVLVYNNNCGNLACESSVVYNQYCGSGYSAVSFIAQAGIEYLIAVSGINSFESGNFDMTVNCIPNEQCPQTLTVSSVSPICEGEDAIFTLQPSQNDDPTPNGLVYFHIDSTSYNVTLDAYGLAQFTVPNTSPGNLTLALDSVFNASQTCVEYLVNSGAVTTLPANDPACGGCTPNMTLNGNPETSGLYQVVDWIESTSKVNSGSGGTVDFRAQDEYIELQPGFEADGTVDFNAEIMPCEIPQ